MKRWYVDQGSAEWWALRLGVPTASNFHKIITPKKLEYSAQASGYMMQLLAERLLQQPMGEDFLAEWAELGKIEQDHARQQFQLVNEVELEPVGFVTTDNKRFGCSPDALFVNRPQALEIKVPKPPKQLEYLFTEEWTVNYRPQVQGQLMIGDFELVHLYVYHTRMKPHHVRTKPDVPFQKILVGHLNRFVDELDALEERAIAEGVIVVPTEGLIMPDTRDRDRDVRTVLEAG